MSLHKAQNKLIQKKQAAAELEITARQARPFAEEAEEEGDKNVVGGGLVTSPICKLRAPPTKRVEYGE